MSEHPESGGEGGIERIWRTGGACPTRVLLIRGHIQGIAASTCNPVFPLQIQPRFAGSLLSSPPMSAIAAHQSYRYSSSTDRRYSSIAQYDSDPSFSYSQPSLGAVTASPTSLEGRSALNNPPTASYVWATHNPSSYLTPSAPANAYSSTPPGPSYSSDYSSHRILVSSCSNPYSVPAPSSSALLSSPSHSSYGASSRSYSSFADAAVSPHHSPHASNRLPHGHWDSNALYTVESSDTMSPPKPSPDADSLPLIKEEDSNAVFVIEVPVPAEQPNFSPIPGVPIRATHVPPKMRRMMYTFRLENFAMYDGIHSTSTAPGSGGIEVGPLREKPIELEWQVHLEDALVPQVPQAFHYGALPPPRPTTPSSSRQSTRTGYSSTGSVSPPLSVEYSPIVKSESWNASSEYPSVADSTFTSTASNSGMPAGSPTFTAPVHSLGWGLCGFRAGEMDPVELSTMYRRPGCVQSSLSRVSQAHIQCLLGGGSTSAYPQQPSRYGYDSATSSGVAF
ncbi:hypothetical protein C8Q74DRAFT_375482 [Fomes fomentarius]|nr:hypothetical protein C8Q74DRAFT_375482 [Fomes fomentarius]